MMKNDLIMNYLDELFPEPKCELNYSSDYELLIAIVLSAQTTDKNVNKVTDILYKKYDSLDKLSRASVDEIYSIVKPIGFKKKANYVKDIATILLNDYNGVIPDKKELLIKNWSKYNWSKSNKLDKPLMEEIKNIKTPEFHNYLAEIYNKRDTVSIRYR